jgi:radical SAM enzyme (TIGR01210 family)
VSVSAVDRRIRSLRPDKPRVDPYRAHGTLLESERRSDGEIERSMTVFLAGAECPFTCTFCDLWRWTIDGPTPPGALAKQLKDVLSEIDGGRPDRLKLYNASNFFDRRAVPDQDFVEIAELARDFSAVTVESHASTIGARTLELARRFGGRLEVAVGLETIHPVASSYLNKRLELARFDQAASFLADNDIDLRVFVLLGAPYIDPSESVEWTVRSVEYAVARGASIVSIIPVRGGNGELERLHEEGLFVPPTLAQLEQTLERCLVFGGCVVTADLWDATRFARCDECSGPRIDRLRRMNLSGRIEPAVTCTMCER